MSLQIKCWLSCVIKYYIYLSLGAGSLSTGGSWYLSLKVIHISQRFHPHTPCRSHCTYSLSWCENHQLHSHTAHSLSSGNQTGLFWPAGSPGTVLLSLSSLSSLTILSTITNYLMLDVPYMYKCAILCCSVSIPFHHQCNLCDVKCSTEHNLKTHIRLKHHQCEE